MGQDGDHFWFGCDIQGRRDGGQNKGCKNHDYEEGGGGLCTVCDGVEEFLNPIQRWAFKIDVYWFDHIDVRLKSRLTKGNKTVFPNSKKR